jgi:YD repeat-containing protein
MRTLFAILLLAVPHAVVGIAQAGSASYTYDALGRLVKVVDSQSGMRQTYQYDAAGNRFGTKQSISGVNGIIPVGTALNSVNGNATLSVSVGGPLATGMVTFYFNDVYAGTAPVIDGIAQIVFQGMPLGSYTVRAVYQGDSHYDPATSVFTVKILDLSWLPAVLDMILN